MSPPIAIRQSTAEDHDWIGRLLAEGTNDGHYSPTVGGQAMDMLDAIQREGSFQMMKLRGKIPQLCFVHATIDVAELNGKAASFLICVVDGSETEIHLSGTKRESRRKGCHRALVRHRIDQLANDESMIARCYKRSTWAVEVLMQEGFALTVPGNPDQFALTR